MTLPGITLRRVALTPLALALLGAPSALVPATAVGQDAGPAAQRAPLHVPRVDRPPELDGVLDDAAWRGAAILDDWVQTTPGDNVDPAGETALYLVHDDDALYLAFRGTDPSGIRYAIHPRDEVLEQGQDWIGVLLDTFNDRRQAFGIALNPTGIQGDGIMLEGGTNIEWDAIYQSAGEIDPDGRGFTLEVRMPFKSLRFSRRPVQEWGLGAVRVYGRSAAEDSPWPLDRDLNCTLCQMLPIRLEGVEPGNNLEVNPAIVVASQAERPDPGLPLDPYENRFEPGLNVKYGITSNLTLDATINPDFSQVESDAGQLEVNNRFALFFPEKRPFFLEGADIFQTGIVPPGGGPFILTPINLIYSRTIVDPDWGTKLSGKAGRFGLGAILSRDAAEPVDLDGDVAEPGSDVAIGRATMDVTADGYVGGVFTGRRHQGETDLVGGVDTRLRLNDNLVFSGIAARSRYDAPRLDGGERQVGSAVQAQLDWGSRHWLAGIGVVDVAPGFTAPLGFVPRDDQILATGSLAWIWQGTGAIQLFQPQLRYERFYDHERVNGSPAGPSAGLFRAGRLVDELWEPSVTISLARSITLGGGYHRAFTYFDGQRFPFQDRYGGFFSSQTLEWLHLNAFGVMGESVIFSDVAVDDAARPSWQWDANVTATFRPIPAIRADLSVTASRIWRRTNEQARSSLFANALINRLRVQYQVTRRLGLRAIAEWRDSEFFDPGDVMTVDAERLSGEFLASYVINAGSAIYIGWSELRDADLTYDLEPDRRGGVAKATYVWRF